jgi:hypothetical protein
VTGRKAAQERFSEEKFPGTLLQPILHHRKRISQQLYRKHPQNSAETHGTQQAWMNSRNSITIATEMKYRQPNLFLLIFSRSETEGFRSAGLPVSRICPTRIPQLAFNDTA